MCLILGLLINREILTASSVWRFVPSSAQHQLQLKSSVCVDIHRCKAESTTQSSDITATVWVLHKEPYQWYCPNHLHDQLIQLTQWSTELWDPHHYHAADQFIQVSHVFISPSLSPLLSLLFQIISEKKERCKPAVWWDPTEIWYKVPWFEWRPERHTPARWWGLSSAQSASNELYLTHLLNRQNNIGAFHTWNC